MAVILQVPSIILPRVWVIGSEQEAVNDLWAHTSIELDVSYLRDKTIQIWATEICPFGGVPGTLWAWVELSPVPSTVNPAYFTALGGGGGIQVGGVPVIVPLAPVIEPAAGVHLRVHGIILPFGIHSGFARLVVWMPIAAAPAMAFWSIQAAVAAKG